MDIGHGGEGTRGLPGASGSVRVMLAATPAWFADNLPQISVGTLLILMLVVLRFVQKMVVRIILLVLIGVAGLLVYINRAPLQACAKTCVCEIAGKHITVPTCRTDLKL